MRPKLVKSEHGAELALLSVDDQLQGNQETVRATVQGTDMGIEAKCGQCGKQYSVPESWGGKRTQCPQCGTPVEIPVPAIDVVVTGEHRADPFFDAPAQPHAAGDPFGPSSARSRTVPGSPRVHTLNALAKRQTGNLMDRIWRGPALLIAVGVGMFVVFAWMLMLLGSLGFGYWLLPSAFLLAVGTVLLVGGVSNRSVRRNRAAVKSRAVRVFIWLAGGLAAGILSFGGMLLFARLGNPIPLVVQIGAPFLLVSLLVALVAALVLGYHFLILAFPKANVFRFAAVGYVGLTALIPILVTVSGVFSRFSRQDQADRLMAARPDELEPLRDPSPFIPPGQPAVPEAANRLIPSRPPAAPSSRSGRNSIDPAPPSSENSGLPLEAASAPPIGPYGLDPHADVRGNGFGRRGFDGEGMRNPGFRGPVFVDPVFAVRQAVARAEDRPRASCPADQSPVGKYPISTARRRSWRSGSAPNGSSRYWWIRSTERISSV